MGSYTRHWCSSPGPSRVKESNAFRIRLRPGCFDFTPIKCLLMLISSRFWRSLVKTFKATTLLPLCAFSMCAFSIIRLNFRSLAAHKYGSKLTATYWPAIPLIQHHILISRRFDIRFWAHHQSAWDNTCFSRSCHKLLPLSSGLMQVSRNQDWWSKVAASLTPSPDPWPSAKRKSSYVRTAHNAYRKEVEMATTKKMFRPVKVPKIIVKKSGVVKPIFH